MYHILLGFSSFLSEAYTKRGGNERFASDEKNAGWVERGVRIVNQIRWSQ
jgi:hypothetical protein